MIKDELFARFMSKEGTTLDQDVRRGPAETPDAGEYPKANLESAPVFGGIVQNESAGIREKAVGDVVRTAEILRCAAGVKPVLWGVDSCDVMEFMGGDTKEVVRVSRLIAESVDWSPAKGASLWRVSIDSASEFVQAVWQLKCIDESVSSPGVPGLPRQKEAPSSHRRVALERIAEIAGAIAEAASADYAEGARRWGVPLSVAMDLVEALEDLRGCEVREIVESLPDATASAECEASSGALVEPYRIPFDRSVEQVKASNTSTIADLDAACSSLESRVADIHASLDRSRGLVRELGRDALREDFHCDSCGKNKGSVVDHCDQSQRSCGHHCNHSWSHDHCCWCGKMWGDEDEASIIRSQELVRLVGETYSSMTSMAESKER